MPALREYFYIDFPNDIWLPLEGTCEISRDDGLPVQVKVCPRVHLDYDSNAIYLTVYVPSTPETLGAILAVIRSSTKLAGTGRAVVLSGGKVGDRPVPGTSLQFAGRIFFYVEDELSDDDFAEMESDALAARLAVVVRSGAYATEMTRIMTPLAFLSHDSRDKEDIAKPLAQRLTVLGCPVWYDEYSVPLGASLIDSIERGIRDCNSAVLVLTKNFLANEGWTKTEFNSIVTRQVRDRQRLILPVWVDVCSDDVVQYNSALADLKGVRWDLGVDEVAQQIRARLTR